MGRRFSFCNAIAAARPCSTTLVTRGPNTYAPVGAAAQGRTQGRYGAVAHPSCPMLGRRVVFAMGIAISTSKEERRSRESIRPQAVAGPYELS